jgi:thiol-disulfide isomerase/thioredoxin
MLIFLCVLCSLRSVFAQVETVHFDYIQKLMTSTSDTTYIINFWATWCKPCVAELPEFEAINAETNGNKIKVILVSMDFKSQLTGRVIPFVKEKKLESKVVLLDEPDYNSWIDKVDKSWGGGIPATLIVNSSKGRHAFYEKEMTREELEKALK